MSKNKRVMVLAIVLTLFLGMSVPIMAEDNEGSDQSPFNVVFVDGGIYKSYEMIEGVTKNFTLQTWASGFRGDNIKREIKVVGNSNVAQIEFMDADGKWKLVNVYNDRTISINSNMTEKFRVTFNKAGEYVMEFTMYDKENKILFKKAQKINVTKNPVATTEQQTAKPQQTTKSQKTTKAQTTTKKVGSTKVKSATKKKSSSKAKISLKKVKNVSGYQIQISATKTFKKVMVKKNVKKYSFTISSKKIKGKKKLYVRARAYKTVNKKKNYGSWTKAKKMKIK